MSRFSGAELFWSLNLYLCKFLAINKSYNYYFSHKQNLMKKEGKTKNVKADIHKEDLDIKKKPKKARVFRSYLKPVYTFI